MKEELEELILYFKLKEYRPILLPLEYDHDDYSICYEVYDIMYNRDKIKKMKIGNEEYWTYYHSIFKKDNAVPYWIIRDTRYEIIVYGEDKCEQLLLGNYFLFNFKDKVVITNIGIINDNIDYMRSTKTPPAVWSFDENEPNYIGNYQPTILEEEIEFFKKYIMK